MRKDHGFLISQNRHNSDMNYSTPVKKTTRFYLLRQFKISSNFQTVINLNLTPDVKNKYWMRYLKS